jgi:hypothetical protein
MSKEAMPGNTRIEGSVLEGTARVILVDSKPDTRGRKRMNKRIADINKRIEGLGPFDMDATKAELVAQGYKVTRLKPGKRPKDTLSYLPSGSRKTRRYDRRDGDHRNQEGDLSGERPVFDGVAFGFSGGWHMTSGRTDNRAESRREVYYEARSLRDWMELKPPMAPEKVSIARFSAFLVKWMERLGLVVPR